MKIAFIITVYKNDKLKYFKEAIDSIVNQDYGFENIPDSGTNQWEDYMVFNLLDEDPTIL